MLREPEHSDDDLLRRIIAGEEDAFVCFYRRWQGRIYRFALHMSGSAPVAEDVTQEAFMSVIRDASRFDPALGTASAYLFGIARNQVLRRLEKDRALVPFQEPFEALGELRSKVPGNGHHVVSVPPVDLGRKQTIDRVREAVLSLPGHYREVVVLCDLQEMSYEEAAAALKCAIGTVRSRLHRARTLLAAKLFELRQTEPKTAVRGRGSN
jgi:RNA polymerase sigma-70 factor, ECF subfamily